MLHPLKRKVNIAANLLRDEGIIAVAIRSLEFLQKHTKSTRRHNPKNQKIKMYAKYQDLVRFKIETKHKVRKSSGENSHSLAWIMPPPGKGSGGHLNIFRFIKFLEDAGYICHIYLYTENDHGSISMVRAIMGDSYPPIKALESMQWLDEAKIINKVGGIFATSWETAYALYSLTTNAKRFYFIQDFEPYFYAVGGIYSLAENTYKMGFYGITAGGWLKKKLSSEYRMAVDSFSFGSDSLTYRYTNDGVRKEVFYYARPFTERRGFEMGILALDLFHRKHPDYTINIVGWDVSRYDIPFPYKNLKTLEISELSELYNRCVAGLVLSYTNMSLLPLELLGCGTIPVVNDAENNRLVSNNEYIAYSQNDPNSLANTLSEIVERKNSTNYAKEAANSVKDYGWDKPGKDFIAIVERELSRD